jgi:hypothetical protein
MGKALLARQRESAIASESDTMRYLALPLVLVLTGAAVAGTIYVDPKAPGGSVGGNDMVNFLVANHFVLGGDSTAHGTGFWTAEPFANPATGESLLPWDRWSGAIEWAFFEHVPGVWADPRLAPNGSTNFGIPAATAFASGVATVSGGAVTKVPHGTTNVHFGPEFYYTVDFGGPVSLLGGTPYLVRPAGADDRRTAGARPERDGRTALRDPPRGGRRTLGVALQAGRGW